MKLRPQYPASFPTLLLAGFTLVALPLLGGMINASYRVEKIVAEGHQAIDVSLAVTQASRQLVSGVSSLQRSAGQYYLLGGPPFLRAFQDDHHAIQAAAAQLQKQPLEAKLRKLVTDLTRSEGSLFERLRPGQRQGTVRFDAFAEDFDDLYGAAIEVESQVQGLINRQIGDLGKSADAVRQAMIWQALAMIPLSLFLTLVFSWLISRPVGQLAREIRRLGEDNLTPFPAVEGPRDLAYLGERLDWLRLRLIDLEQQQLRFLRHVSHELKTPLATLREGVALLADGTVGELGPQQQEVTEIMHGNVRELQRRIEDLISYSRVSHGSEPLANDDLALDDLLAVAVRRHGLALNSKSIDLALAVNGVRVRGDRPKLESVFENLLGNAIRFSPQAGRIEISAASTECQATVTVCDQGPGVPGEDREHVFRPFYQGSLQPPGALSGSGLGLAIVKEYVELHGGQVSLLDSHPGGDTGKGACFLVRLPVVESGDAH